MLLNGLVLCVFVFVCVFVFDCVFCEIGCATLCVFLVCNCGFGSISSDVV